MVDSDAGSIRGILQDVLGAAVDYEQARSDRDFWNGRATSTTSPQPGASAAPAASVPASKLPAWLVPVGLGVAALVVVLLVVKK